MLSSNKKITNLGLQFRKTDLIKKKKRRNKDLQADIRFRWEIEMNKLKTL